MQTTNVKIPLKDLSPWEGNVRKTNSDHGIDELAASIEAHGLLSSLVVAANDDEPAKVIAGKRRLAALNKLMDAGKLSPDFLVPCQMAEGNAAELSLAENTVREQMHPADEFEAFKALVDEGTPIADIAARFGVDDTVVQKRLKLAKVSSSVLQAFRSGRINLEQVMAFAITDDHKRQDRVLKSLPKQFDPEDWNSEPARIRKSLTEGLMKADDKEVKFVGLEAYKKAGGTLRTDLFSDDLENTVLEDPELLQRLVKEKLEKAKAKVLADGWSWAEINLKIQSYEIHQMPRIEKARGGDFKEKEKALAGCIISIDYQNKVEIHYGLVKKKDLKALKDLQASNKKAKPKKAVAKTGSDDAEETSASIPSSVIYDLSLHREAAMQAEMARQPGVALAAVVHTMGLKVFYRDADDDDDMGEEDYDVRSCVRVHGEAYHANNDTYDRKGLSELQGIHADLLKLLPKKPSAFWDWCLTQKQEVLLGLLAFCAGVSIEASFQRLDPEPSGSRLHGIMLAEALGLDMTAYFAPNATNYFGRVPKPVILADIKDITGEEPTKAQQGMKKAPLAAEAEKAVATVSGPAWLPAIIRAPVVEEKATKHKKAA